MSFQKNCFSDSLNAKRQKLGDKIHAALHFINEVEVKCLSFVDENEESGVFVNVELKLHNPNIREQVKNALEKSGFRSCGEIRGRAAFSLPSETDLDVRVYY